MVAELPTEIKYPIAVREYTRPDGQTVFLKLGKPYKGESLFECLWQFEGLEGPSGQVRKATGVDSLGAIMHVLEIANIEFVHRLNELRWLDFNGNGLMTRDYPRENDERLSAHSDT